MFIDKTDIRVRAGDGGKGCNSFCHIKLHKKRPDGGDGGEGGDIILKADKNVQTLVDFYYRKHFKADAGRNGSSNHKKGAYGKDCIIRVPLGTIVKDKNEDIAYCDLKTDGQSVIFLKGGAGGKGNSKYRESTPGEQGEEKEVILELKLIADAGIIGCPNAGKSSLISRISNARPKIASYPFTTKAPVLGAVKIDAERSFIICDIPGLIEGAHEGKGLGHEFLRHIERTKMLVHMIDMAGVDGRDPADDYKSINHELGEYSAGLMEKQQILVANKMDLPVAADNLKKFRKKVKKRICLLSCATGNGISELIEAVYKKLHS
jgi:GTP-binding protein